jgi:hypothetical protein
VSAAEDDGPPLPLQVPLSLEVPMEPLPDVVIPRVELAVRVRPPASAVDAPVAEVGDAVEVAGDVVVDEPVGVADAVDVVDAAVVVDEAWREPAAMDNVVGVLEPVLEPVDEPVGVLEPVLEPVDEPVADEGPALEPVPLARTEGREAGTGALRPKAPVPASTVVTRPLGPGELDRRRPLRGLVGLTVVVLFAAVAVAVAIGVAIVGVTLAVRGSVGG